MSGGGILYYSDTYREKDYEASAIHYKADTLVPRLP